MFFILLPEGRMKLTIPEISWHNRDPVLSVDLQQKSSTDIYRLVTSGTDSHILVSDTRIIHQIKRLLIKRKLVYCLFVFCIH